MILSDWFNTHGETESFPHVTLQIVESANVAFDSTTLGNLHHQPVEQFDLTALVQSPEVQGTDWLRHWQAVDRLLDDHLAGHDGMVSGGDLAYEYGLYGGLDGLLRTQMTATLKGPQFGEQPQHISVS